MKSIADRLREIRASLGLSQRQMAEHLEIPVGTYQDHELGKSTQKFEMLERLLERGFSSDWLISGRGAMRLFASGVAEDPPQLGVVFNERLLKIVVSEIEHILNEADAELAPDKKAELVAAVYEMALENEGKGQPIDRTKVVRLVRLAG